MSSKLWQKQICQAVFTAATEIDSSNIIAALSTLFYPILTSRMLNFLI